MIRLLTKVTKVQSARTLMIDNGIRQVWKKWADEKATDNGSPKVGIPIFPRPPPLAQL